MSRVRPPICACSVLQIASESSFDLLLSVVGLQEESAMAGGHVTMYGVIAHSYFSGQLRQPQLFVS